MICPVVKVVLWSRGLTWQSQVVADPIPIPHPTNLALFGHKITLYRFNQGGSYYCRGGSNRSRGLSPPGPLTLTTRYASAPCKLTSYLFANWRCCSCIAISSYLFTRWHLYCCRCMVSERSAVGMSSVWPSSSPGYVHWRWVQSGRPDHRWAACVSTAARMMSPCWRIILPSTLLHGLCLVLLSDIGASDSSIN